MNANRLNIFRVSLTLSAVNSFRKFLSLGWEKMFYNDFHLM